METAPNTETTVQGNTYLSYSCYVTLADNDRIILELDFYSWNKAKAEWEWVTEKAQLERLHYRDTSEGIEFAGGVVRRFRKDGALKYREAYIPNDQWAKAISQIPDHYHDIVRIDYPKKLAELKERIIKLETKGLQLLP